MATHEHTPRDLQDQLTRREHEVLLLMVEGNSNKEIGRLLNRSPRTVEIHRSRVLDKLGARNSTHAVVIAVTTGIVPTSSEEPQNISLPPYKPEPHPC